MNNAVKQPAAVKHVDKNNEEIMIRVALDCNYSSSVDNRLTNDCALNQI